MVQLKINKKGKIGLILIFLWHTLVFTQNGTTIALDKEQIITSDNYHNSFPSVVKLEEGQVLVSYRKGKGHLSPVASAVYKTSNDNGKSFQNELIIENGNDFINTKHGIRNLIINELNDGRLLATFWINDYPKGNTYYKISEDQGLTWGERKEVLDKNTITNFIGVEGRMIEINGDYILPVFVKKSLISNNMYAGVMISRDLVNWTCYEVSRKISDNNESVILFGNNHWQLLYFYRNVTENALYRSESHDLGRTWSNPENVSFPGYVQSRPDIAFYPDNNQMYLLYREGKYQTGTIAVSHDKGLTWKRLTGIYKDSTRFTYGGMVNVKRNKSILIYSTETHLNGVNSTIKNRFLRLKKD